MGGHTARMGGHPARMGGDTARMERMRTTYKILDLSFKGRELLGRNRRR